MLGKTEGRKRMRQQRMRLNGHEFEQTPDVAVDISSRVKTYSVSLIRTELSHPLTQCLDMPHSYIILSVSHSVMSDSL